MQKTQQNVRRVLILAGVSLAFLYMLLFLLLQSHTLWESPTLLQDRWPELFYPLRDLFPAEWIWASRRTPLGTMNIILYVLLVAALFTVFLFTARILFTRRNPSDGELRSSLRLLVGFTVGFLSVLFIVPGTFSTDLFSYAWYGRIYGLLGDNPFLRVPSDYAWFDTEGWLQWVYWKDVPSAYGPAWVLIAAGIAQIAAALDNDIVTHILGHKLLASAAHVGNIILVWHLAGYVVRLLWVKGRDLGASQIGVTFLYAWNPLLLVEFGASGHNDVLMLTGLFAALLALFKQRLLIAALFFALACLIKASAVIFIPGFLWLILWRGRDLVTEEPPRSTLKQRVALTAAAVATLFGVWILFYLPFWAGPATFDPLVGGPPARLFVHSIGTIVRFQLPEWLAGVAVENGWQPVSSWTATAIGNRLEWPARWGPLAIFFVVSVFQTLYARTISRVLLAWSINLLSYLLIGAVWLWPWYVSWLYVPVILLGPGRLLTTTLIFSATGLSLYAIYPVVDEPFHRLPDWTGLWLCGPPILYLAGSTAHEWLKGHRKGPELQVPAPSEGVAR
jgi:hypothetical protein